MKVGRRTGLMGIVLVAAFATGCQQYSDDAIRAMKTILRTNSDDAAIKVLDDAARIASVEGPVIERAAIAWSARVVPIRDRILARLTGTPDDVARVRAFVVGSTCDAFKEAAKWPNGLIPEDRMSTIISENRAKSGMPLILGLPELVADLTDSIRQAITDGDIAESGPGLGQALTCAVLAG